MPRRSAADTAATHASIVDRAVHMASTDGLEGLTIGRLAGDLSMSKAGVIGHFGTKEELQHEALA
jgi:AcrR family transcriptional regulator